MSPARQVDVEVVRSEDHLMAHWSAGPNSGSCRFDRIPGTSPEWLGSGEELVEGADRRTADRIVAALADWARAEGEDLGLWHDDEGIETLG